MPRDRWYGRPLEEAVEQGRIPASLIDDAARRVLAIKLRTGLFARPIELDGERVGTPEHRALALDAARESIVLLQNRDDLLPLSLAGSGAAPAGARQASIAVIGPWASRAALGGRGSSEVRALRPVTLVQGLRAVAPGGTRILAVSDWRDDGAVRQVAGDAGVVVLALGLGPRIEGESLDRAGNDLVLPDDQTRLIETAVAANPRVVVVLYAGSAVAMDPWIERVPAVVLAWYPGELGGRAVAEVLLGAVDPSGRLPLTFPRAAAQLPAFGAFPERVSEYREGVFVGYRHFDARGLDPLFPFGYGRSYTRFEYSDLRLDPRGAGDTTAIGVTFTVRNLGERAGVEVAQVYVHDLESSVPRPPRELKGFARVKLDPGELRVVSVTLGFRDLAFFDEAAHGWTVEPGAFEVQVGASSRDVRLRQTFNYPPETPEP
jgi:beta-glucosidase